MNLADPVQLQWLSLNPSAFLLIPIESRLSDVPGLQQFCHQTGPAGLMRSASTPSGIAVKILMKQ
jgi:hypothetical protein